MPTKTLLFLSSGQIQACTWRNGVLSAPHYFSDRLEGRDEFDAFLQVHRAPVSVLADIVEEDFRNETVPHLRGKDRTTLLQRKFDQCYRSTPFRQALLQRRRQDGRRDDEMLFCALTNPGMIFPWLEIMQRHGTPLAGIYSVAGISAPLIDGVASSRLLLLSWENHAGLRQTYFHDKRLYFSRLTQLDNGAAFSDLIDSEVARTHQYLRSLNLVAPGDVLDVLIICHADDRAQMEAALIGSPNIRHNYLDLQELARRFGSRNEPASSDAAPLFLHMLAARPPRSQYAGSAHTHFFRLQQLNRALFGLGGVFAAISLLWSAANLWESSKMVPENESLQMQASQVLQQAQQTTQSLPGGQSAAADMKTAVLLMRKLDHYAAPKETLSDLSAVMDSHPHIRINDLSWQTDAAAEAPAAGGTPSSLAAQAIMLKGELEGLAGSHRAVLDYLERFQQALTQSGYQVIVLTLPLDVSPKGSISTAAVENTTKPAEFTLKLVRRQKE